MPLSRYVYRPIAFLLTWFAVRIGITTECASWLSGIVGVSGIVCLMGKQMGFVWVGIGLLLGFNLLDCVDGSIARVMKTENPYGKFLDAVFGDIVDFVFFGAIGVLALRHPHLLYRSSPFDVGSPFWFLIGSLTAFFFILLRHIELLFDQQIWELEVNLRMAASSSEADRQDQLSSNNTQSTKYRTWKDILRLLDRNLKVRETHYLFFIIAISLNAIDVFLLFFLVYYFIHTLITGGVYFYRAKRVRDRSLE